MESNGYMVQAMYYTEWDLQPVVKYEFFDPDTSIDKDTALSPEVTTVMKETRQANTNLTFGLNYFFNDWTRLQFNYIMKDENYIDTDNDRILVQLQVKF